MRVFLLTLLLSFFVGLANCNGQESVWRTSFPTEGCDHDSLNGLTFSREQLPSAIDPIINEHCPQVTPGTARVTSFHLGRGANGRYFYNFNSAGIGYQSNNGQSVSEITLGFLKLQTGSLAETAKPGSRAFLEMTGRETTFYNDGTSLTTKALSQKVAINHRQENRFSTAIFTGGNNLPDNVSTIFGGYAYPDSKINVYVEDTLEGILHNSVTATKKNHLGDPLRPGITATFTPRNSLGHALDKNAVAQHFGYKGFRWVQRVLFPSDWQVSTAPGVPERYLDGFGQEKIRHSWFRDDEIKIAQQDPNDWSTWMVDSYPDSNRTVVLRSPGFGGEISHTGLWYAKDQDDLDFYNNDLSGRDFEDFPRQFEGMFDPGDRLNFVTSLVAVRDDGTYRTFDGIGTNIRWSSDTEYHRHDNKVDIINYLSSRTWESSAGSYLRGEVSNISYDLNSVIVGDVSGDGVVNFLDIAPFIAALLPTANFQDEADVNRDGVVNFLDIASFIALLSSP